MKQDRFLIAILVAVGILVVAALLVFFLRQDSEAYGADDTPQGVVRNYIIAIHQGDFERAYQALQDTPDKPSYQEFQQPFLANRLDTSNVSVRITNTNTSSDNAVVNLILTHGGTGLFDGSWSEHGSAILVQQNGSWKLVEMPYPYWNWEWD
jgi:archaellum component FlaF (FlaF/FlaG flagellin family)